MVRRSSRCKPLMPPVVLCRVSVAPRADLVAGAVVILAGAVLLAAAAVPAAAEERPAAPQPTGKLAEILARIPSDKVEEARAAYADLVGLGPKGVTDLAALVVEPGAMDDSKARHAVHGLVLYVARPGAEAERMMVCEALRGLLDGPTATAVKGFLLQQLRLVACPAAVPAVAKCLLDETLCEDAAQTLVSLGGEQAAQALREALPKARGKVRLTLIQDLGVVRDAASVPALLKAAADADRDVRLTALSALGAIGDPAATDVLLAAAKAESPYERARATDALLALARRLGEAGRKADAEKVYRTLWTERTAVADRHVRCAALEGLATLLGAGAMADLLEGIRSEDPQVRAAAVEAAVAVPGEAVTARWVEQMKALGPEGRAGVVRLVARRGGPASGPAVIQALKDADEGVRLAAIEAAATVAGDGTVAPLVAILGSAAGKEKDAARTALGRAAGDAATAAVAAASASAAPALRRELLAVLAARGARGQLPTLLAAARDADKDVRVAALKALETLADETHAKALAEAVARAQAADEREAAEKALGAVCARAKDRDACAAVVTGALAGAPIPVKASLVRVLAKTGGAKAAEAVRAALKDPSEEIQDAGVRALADWPDETVAADLLAVARTASRPAHQVLALRGYVRLAGGGKRPAAERLRMLGEATAAARRPEDRRLVLGAVGDVKDAAALEMAAGALADPALVEEAAAAVVKIVKALGEKAPKDAARAALEKVLASAKGAGVRQEAEGLAKRL